MTTSPDAPPDKTENLSRRIFSSILEGKYPPGSRLPSERDLADQEEVSRITVRRAIDALVSSGILLRKQGSGTFVAKERKANGDAGKFIALLGGVEEAFALDFVRSLERAAADAGKILVLRLTGEDPEQEARGAIALAAAGIRNLVLWPTGKCFQEETFRRLRVIGVNLVFFDRVVPTGQTYADYVGVDNSDALGSLFDHADKPIRHAVFLAHRKVLYDTDTLREGAFLLECAKRKIKGRVIRIDRETPDVSVWHGADAVFCVNDATAKKVQPFIPVDVPIFGIDGLGRTFPTYVQPMAAMARKVVELLERQQALGSRWTEQRIFMKGNYREKQF